MTKRYRDLAVDALDRPYVEGTVIRLTDQRTIPI